MRKLAGAFPHGFWGRGTITGNLSRSGPDTRVHKLPSDIERITARSI